MMNGNMAFGIHKEFLIIRTSPERAEELLKRQSVSLLNMTGRPMAGWLTVSPECISNDEQLMDMLNLAIEYVGSLPAK